jgi:hypothetical protein
LRKVLREVAGLETPPLAISRIGCLLLGVVFLGGLGVSLATWSEAGFAGWALAIPIAILDRGAWDGDWKTLGSLAKAVAIRNVASFVQGGARNRERDWWRSFTNLIAGSATSDRDGAAVESERIAPTTRFNFQ